jgi:hypothetical protein
MLQMARRRKMWQGLLEDSPPAPTQAKIHPWPHEGVTAEPLTAGCVRKEGRLPSCTVMVAAGLAMSRKDKSLGLLDAGLAVGDRWI